MEEEGGCSSQKRRPYDPSITAQWASLQPDLVQHIADCILTTSGVDEYMAMRAVCPTWRSAVAKPSPHAAVADLRFRPRQWVLLNEADDDQGRPLFLNVTTGRFRRLRRPVLRDYILVGASDGLLVLGDTDPPHAARLLNPLTGDMLPFAAPIPREPWAPIPSEPWVDTAVTSSEPTIIFSSQHGSKYLQSGIALYSADPTGQLRVVKLHDAALKKAGLFYLQSMVTYAGNVYVLSSGGTLCKIVWTGEHWYAERILDIDMKYIVALVEATSKLLLVKEQLETIEVFSIDVERKLLEPIKSLGSSALFLSHGNCMVVDADKLPSIKRNCIYSTFCTVFSIDRIYAWCDLGNGEKKFLTVSHVPVYCPGTESGIIHEGPLSLAEVLLNPYPKVKDQLDHFRET
ncbi:hypothetical protein CFC21_038276 [Triticum aestivum]|uniref:KIB1-4 beta-propeller domain-containing protein n=4 Tax=Triticum TaxID=4564 RepID=A0A9R0S117_TRITD|nr:hypothetical protein CFC21_038276 [Triticum aestivum]VAH69526.1 unnamed protein product [Triticum turgidum subsp. durum]